MKYYKIPRRKPSRGADLVIATVPAADLLEQPPRKQNPAGKRKPKWVVEAPEDLLQEPWSGYEGFVVRTVLLRAKEYRQASKDPPRIRTSLDVVKVCQWLQNEPTEHICLLCISVDSRLVAVHELSKGGAHAAGITPEDVAQVMLLTSSMASVLVHNHPHSSEINPSRQDMELTAKLEAGLKCLGLTLVDHVIVGRDDRFFSFAERGMMERGE